MLACHAAKGGSVASCALHAGGLRPSWQAGKPALRLLRQMNVTRATAFVSGTFTLGAESGGTWPAESRRVPAESARRVPEAPR